MQPLTFHPVVADIGGQLVDIATDSIEAGGTASTSLTGLPPAGAEEVSAQAVMAFAQEANSMLALNKAAQEELMRAGTALNHITQMYTEADQSAAENLVFGLVLSTSPVAGWTQTA